MLNQWQSMGKLLRLRSPFQHPGQVLQAGIRNAEGIHVLCEGGSRSGDDGSAGALAQLGGCKAA